MQSFHQWESAELIETAWNESPGIARREQATVIAELVGFARNVLATWWSQPRGDSASAAC